MGANFIATGHDADWHCQNGGSTISCDFLKILVDSVRKGSSLPVLSIDSGTLTTNALTKAGVTPVTPVSPRDATTFNAVPLVDGLGNALYSAIVVGSSSFVADITPADSANINARADDIKTFFNAGGGILALSGAGMAGYYNFVPITITGRSVSPPFTVQARGVELGMTSGMVNCCATHNSFDPAADPVVTLETDSTGAAETIAAFDAVIGDGGFAGSLAVTIDGGATVHTNVGSSPITGTTDAPAGSTVTVTVNGQTLTGTVTAGATWSVTPTALPEGEYPINASVTRGTTTATANQTRTVDTTAPGLEINGGETVLTNNPTPAITGETDSEPGTTVTVTVGGQTLTATVQEGGGWSVTPSALVDGEYPVTATVTDLAGNSASVSQTLTVDATAPTLTIDGGPTVLTNDNAAAISGTTDAAPGSTVSVSVAGQTLGGVVDADGTWMVIPTAIADGAYDVTATVSDAAGNVATATQSLTVDTTAPQITFDSGPATVVNNSTPTISGSTDAVEGTTVTVSVGGQTLTTTVAADGTWSVDPTALVDGRYTVTVQITDAAGNTGTATQELTVDTVAPTVAINGGAGAATNSITPTITGTTDLPAGSTVTVEIGLQTLTATVGAGGTWSVTAETLSPGQYEVIATIADEAGNQSQATQLLTIDIEAPSIAINGPATVLTKNATPTFTGTTDAEPGSTVTVTVGGQTGTTTVAGDGTWRFTAARLTDGSHTVTASVTDRAGNASSNATVALTVDTTPPVGTLAGGGTGAPSTNRTPTISGTTDAPVGSTVSVVINGKTLTGVVGSGGSWTVTVSPALPDGEYPYTVTFVDPAGNQRTLTGSVTVDTTPPTSTINGGASVTVHGSTATISGVTDAPVGSTVVVTVNGVEYTTTVQVAGVWAITTGSLPDGRYTVTVAITDLAGNTTITTQELVIDNGPGLATTGADLGTPLTLAVVLLLLGGGLSVIARRRVLPNGVGVDG